MILTTYRLKNEERWIERSIKSVLPFSEKILVLDDHSEDKTVQICKSFNKVTLFSSPFTGLDEVRDKNYLLGKTLAEKPEWVFSLDGDEEIEGGAKERFERILPTLEAISPTPMLNFQFFYFWDSETQYRFDGVYFSFFQTRMYKVPEDTTRLTFSNTGAAAGFHCGSVPNLQNNRHPIMRAKSRIKHYGYLEREQRLNKYIWYSIFDNENKSEGRYEHIINPNTHLSPGPMIFEKWVESTTPH